MTNLSSDTDEKHSVISPVNRLVKRIDQLRKLKQLNSSNEQENRGALKKKILHDKYSRLRHREAHSENKLTLINRSTMQEKLFVSKCNDTKRRNSECEPVASSSSAINSDYQPFNRITKHEDQTTPDQRGLENRFSPRKAKMYIPKIQQHKAGQNKNSDNENMDKTSDSEADFKLQLHCKRLKDNYNLDDENWDEPTDSSCATKNSKSENESFKLQLDRPWSKSSDDDGDIKPEYSSSVLHLRQPLVNVCNEYTYYNSRGRMEHVDWAEVKGNAKCKKNLDSICDQTKEFEIKTQKLLKIESKRDTLFHNFIKNSNSLNTTFREKGNIKNHQNYIDQPLLRIEKMINSRDINTSISISGETMQLFQLPQSHLGMRQSDIIESSFKKLESLQGSQAELKKVDVDCEHELLLQGQPNEENEISYKNKLKLKVVERLMQSRNDQIQFHDTLHECTSQDSLNTMNDNNERGKINTRLNEIVNCDDEMFNFTKPPSRESRSVNSLNSSIPSSASFSSRNSFFRQLQNSMINTSDNVNGSLDSDDTSSVYSRDFDELSFHRSSTKSKYDAWKKKVNSMSSEYSPKPKVNDDVGYKGKDYGEENSHECLMKQNISRYFNHLDSEAIENKNIVEVTRVERTPKKEEQLRPLSTKYYTKLTSEIISSDRESGSKKNDEDLDKLSIDKANQRVLDLTADEDVDSSDLSSETQQSDSKLDEFISVNDAMKDIKQYLSQTSDESVEISDRKYEATIENRSTNSCGDLISNEYNGDASKFSNINVIQQIDYNFENANQTSVIIQEIDSDNNEIEDDKIELKVESDEIKSKESDSIISSKSQNSFMKVMYEPDIEDIDSDEEFDVVNIEEFGLFNTLVNKLKTIQDSFIQTVIEDEYSDSETSNNKNRALRDTQSTESSLEISDNVEYSASASISSNLDSPSDSINTSNSLLDSKNIFANVHIDDRILNNCRLDYYNNDTENTENSNSAHVPLSKRMKKKQNTLDIMKKNQNSENSPADIQPLVNSTHNMYLPSSGLMKHHQILNEIQKLKLHLNYKPLAMENVNK